MKKAVTFLCGITAAILMTGCSSVMPELTEEETEIISEYAVGVLLKYDRVSSGRLMSQSEYEAAEIKKLERENAKSVEESEKEEETTGEDTAVDTETIDVSQDETVEAVTPSTIEDYYGIQDFTFQYNGYELVQSYPSGEEEEIFFSMDATEGMQLLVVKFIVTNTGSADQTLNMLEHGAKFRISVNGGTGENALSTMLLNDLQAYKDEIPAGSNVELVSIVEIPQSTNVETIEFTMRGDAGNAVINLQ